MYDIKKNAMKQWFCHIRHSNKMTFLKISHITFKISYKAQNFSYRTFLPLKKIYKYLQGNYNDISGLSMLQKIKVPIYSPFLSYMTPNMLYRTIKCPIFQRFVFYMTFYGNYRPAIQFNTSTNIPLLETLDLLCHPSYILQHNIVFGL